MRILRDMSIRRKLMTITLMISGASLLVACALFFTYDYYTFRKLMVRDLTTAADLIGANSTANLTFGDKDAAREALGTLRVEPGILGSQIHTADNELFVEYLRDGVTEPQWLHEVKAGEATFRDNSLVIVREIHLAGKPIGTIRIWSDLRRLDKRIQNYALTLAAVLMAGLAVSLVVVRRAQRLLTEPILNLTATAREVAEKRNYDTRAIKTTQDELGTLVDCFNGMLAQIQARDTELTMHRENLEQLVQLRTAELVAARDKAREASQAKSTFLANMSHEIRTPMTAILGYADLMLAPVQTMSDRINCLQVVRRNAMHLMDLINDILDISKIEAEKLTVEKIPCDPAQIAVEVVSMLRPRAMAKNLHIAVEFSGPIPVACRTDPLRLKQVLVNLTGNAIKFTEMGQVSIALRVERSGNSSRICFDVRDSGIGITEEQKQKLFMPFAQADESMTRKYGGTGLGLVISKRLATLMGGELTVTTDPGRGSTFSFWVDGGSVDGIGLRSGLTESMLTFQETATSDAQLKLTGKILLAEDGIDNQQLLSLHLRQAGAQVEIVANGLLAVQRVQSERFDVVLMDMQMPEMDGYQATTKLRQLGYVLPVIALTAHAMSGDREKCLTAGCTDYLTKPIDRDLLIRTVAGYLAAAPEKRAGMPTAPASSPSAAPRLTPLIPPGGSYGEAMRAAIDAFIERLPQRVAAITDLLARHEIDELRRMVHQLKGAGSGYGFPGITEVAAKAEARIRGASSMELIQSSIEELIELIRSVDGYQREQESWEPAAA